MLEHVQSNGRHLLGLINDVLDLSKIEAGHLDLSISEYSMKQVVQTVISGTEALVRGAPPEPGWKCDQIHRVRGNRR